jgi:zeaxanthin glucosyltransferase
LNEGAGPFVKTLDALYVPSRKSRPLADVIARAANPNGPLGILRTVADTADLTERLCQHAPALLAEWGADAIVGDQMEPAAGLIARHMKLPMMSIACALPIETEPTIPLPFLPWAYDPTERGIKRNEGGERVARLLLTQQRRTLSRWSAHFGLTEKCETLQDCLSPLGTIAQVTAEVDFPRQDRSRPMFSVGPIRDLDGGEPLDFEIDPDKPFVFMSLGTLQGHRLNMFRAAANACRRLGVQLLVAHCGGLTAGQAASLGATWVRDFVPQRAALRRADLCITHGGMNTVMDALEFGKPLIVLPIAFDQPGVASRVAHHGAGLRLSRHFRLQHQLEHAILTLIDDPSYRERAAEIGRSVKTSGGLTRAVDLLEEKLAVHLP